MMRFFKDQKGIVWTVFADGTTNNPSNPNILEEIVEFLDRELTVEYEAKLYSSIMEIAIDIDYPEIESNPDKVTLDEAVGETLRSVIDFRRKWVESNQETPEHYPMELPRDDEGTYHEQIFDHNISDNK